jgi:hypothetical protein
MPTKRDKATTQAHDGQVIAGIKKDLQSATTIMLIGEAYTPTSLIALYQSRIDAANAVATTKAKYTEAVATYQAINTKGVAVNRAFEQYVVNAYGRTSTVLADFDFTPSKRATLTPEQKAAAAAKRLATRKARGTTGPKAKLATTGQTVELAALKAAVASATAAPVTAPVASPVHAPTVAPAPAPEPVGANGAPPAATAQKA